MTIYYVQENEQIVLNDTDKQKLQNTLLFMPQYTGLEILETEDIIYEGKIITQAEFEAIKAEKEAERIAMLNLTAADVERAIYKAVGMDFEDILTLVEQSKATGLDIKALKIELKANNFYRGNAYIDAVGTILGFTKDQLDKFFDTNDYRYLTSCKLTINATPDTALITINRQEVNEITVPYGSTVEYAISNEGYITQGGSVELTENKVIEVVLNENPTDNTTDVPDEVDTADNTTDETDADNAR